MEPDKPQDTAYSDPGDSSQRPEPRGLENNRIFTAVILIMVAVFIFTVCCRNMIRAQWFAHQLRTGDSAESRFASAQRLAELGPHALSPALDLIGQESVEMRLLGVLILHRTPGDEASAGLARASLDPEMTVRRLAIQGLAVRGEDRDLEHLKSILDSADERTGMMAVAAIGEFGADRSTPILARAIQSSPHPGVRVEAIVRVRNSGSLGAVEALLAVLDDDTSFAGTTEADALAESIYAAVGQRPFGDYPAGEGPELQIDRHHVVGEEAEEALEWFSGHIRPDDQASASRQEIAEYWHKWWSDTQRESSEESKGDDTP